MAPERVALSGATLVVVPPELIPHWLHQIQEHTRPGALRVAVLGEVLSFLALLEHRKTCRMARATGCDLTSECEHCAAAGSSLANA